MAAVAKGECQLSQNEFYKLFDANTRGKTSYHTEFDDTGRNSIGTAKPIAACGLHVQFSSHTMRDVNLISESNPCRLRRFRIARPEVRADPRLRLRPRRGRFRASSQPLARRAAFFGAHGNCSRLGARPVFFCARGPIWTI